MPDDPNDPVGFQVRVGPAASPVAPAPETPFRIAILGDFSGRTSRAVTETGEELAGRKPLRVDRDNLDELMARLAPEVQLPTEPRLSVSFSTLSEFHPDELFRRLPIFQELRDARKRLGDPASSKEALRELVDEPAPAAGPAPEGEGAPVPENLLDQILDRAPGARVDAEAAVTGDLAGLVKRIVEPYLDAAADPRVGEVQESLDAAAAGLMRALLHAPSVQALEAAWRGVDLLVRRLETSVQLQLHLIDVSKQELAADQAPDSDIEKSGLFKLLVDSSVGTPGAEPWALLVGDYTFGPQDEDLLLLARLGALASLAGAPWISAAHPQLAGFDSFAHAPDPASWRTVDLPLWDALRREPQAAWLGLALPRFLLRLPYGAEAEPCDILGFEELSQPPRHDQLLWGNPAFACGLLLGQSFSAGGWAAVTRRQDIDRLPLHLHRDTDGDMVAQPCGEALLTERAADLLLDKGLMPLATLKGHDTVRLVRFQSIRHPLTPLQGRWTPGNPHDH
ncbi:MAG TPA: type VI secretion system contractile sheath large subunit [Gemmatimonadota bacterium]|nr:type VI secretion system contractile sheath large subunit [Gemmatimonadota bacterium]